MREEGAELLLGPHDHLGPLVAWGGHEGGVVAVDVPADRVVQGFPQRAVDEADHLRAQASVAVPAAGCAQFRVEPLDVALSQLLEL